MAKPLDTSSGDILADRRADYAEMLFGSGEAGPAAELMLGALELAPGWAMGWFRLGEFHEAAGDMEAAARPGAWRKNSIRRTGRARASSWRSPARRLLSPCRRAPSSRRCSTSMRRNSTTRWSKRSATACRSFWPRRSPARGRGRFGLALDLGCGTGLMGERLRPFCDRLEGFDISAEMLRKARAKRVYDRLEKADLQTFSYDGPKADLVTAADVFMYVGALEGIVRTVAGLLAEDGLFAFSVEKLAGDGDFALQPSRRYAHSEKPMSGEVLAAEAVLCCRLSHRDENIIRQDRSEPVEGLIVVAGSTQLKG